MDKKYRRNIAASYLFRFLYSFELGDGIWVLYLLWKGLTLWQVGLLEGVFHMAGLVSEVPSGALADRLGLGRVIFCWARSFSPISPLRRGWKRRIVRYRLADDLPAGINTEGI